MAIARRSTDLWGYVQRALLENTRPNGTTGTVRVLSPTPLVRELDEPGWYDQRLEERAAAQLVALESAVASGKVRRAARSRSAWFGALHSDRVARARSVGSDHSLRCDPMGRGPLVDEPTVYYRDRLPWTITPLSPYRDPRLPSRAASVVDEWRGAGELFDAFLMADEPPTSALPTHCLVGVIATDGRCTDWFVLDRWAT